MDCMAEPEPVGSEGLVRVIGTVALAFSGFLMNSSYSAFASARGSVVLMASALSVSARLSAALYTSW